MVDHRERSRSYPNPLVPTLCALDCTEFVNCVPTTGVFTQLSYDMGIRGTQVEEIVTMDDMEFHNLAPVYGLIFLFKWTQVRVLPAHNTTCPASTPRAKQTLSYTTPCRQRCRFQRYDKLYFYRRWHRRTRHLRRVWRIRTSTSPSRSLTTPAALRRTPARDATHSRN